MSQQLQDEIARGERPDRPIRRWLAAARAWVHAHPRLRLAYLTLVALLGGLIVLTGIVLIPLPGPGWLIVFLGLAVLGTEFGWANRLAGRCKRVLARFWSWWQDRRAARAARAQRAARPAPAATPARPPVPQRG